MQESSALVSAALVKFVAGYVPTATALLGNELTEDPEIQEGLHDNINTALSNYEERQYSLEKGIEYLDMTRQETLRLHSQLLSFTGPAPKTALYEEQGNHQDRR